MSKHGRAANKDDIAAAPKIFDQYSKFREIRAQREIPKPKSKRTRETIRATNGALNRASELALDLSTIPAPAGGGFITVSDVEAAAHQKTLEPNRKKQKCHRPGSDTAVSSVHGAVNPLNKEQQQAAEVLAGHRVPHITIVLPPSDNLSLATTADRSLGEECLANRCCGHRKVISPSTHHPIAQQVVAGQG